MGGLGESFWGLGEIFVGLFGEFWRVIAVTKGVFAVPKVVKAANVCLLALYKEGKSDPDPPPWTPLLTTELCHKPRVPHLRLVTKPATIVGCYSTEYPLSPTARHPTEL